MAIRKFVAPTTREAMMQVRRELGDDAVIIANRRVGNRIEILAAAPDAVDALVERSETRAASPLRDRALAHERTRGEPPQPKAEPFQDFVRRQMHADAEKAALQTPARDAGSRSNIASAGRSLAGSSGVAMYHDVADFEHEEATSAPPQQAEPAATRTPVPAQVTTLPQSHRAQQIETSVQATDPAVFRRRPAHVAAPPRTEPVKSAPVTAPVATPTPPIDIVPEPQPEGAKPPVATAPEPRIERPTSEPVNAVAAGHAAVPVLPVRSQAAPIATAARLREASVQAAAQAAALQAARSDAARDVAATPPRQVATPVKAQTSPPPIGAWSWEAQFIAAPAAANPSPEPAPQAPVASEPAQPQPVQPVQAAEPEAPRMESQLLAELQSMRDMLRQQIASLAAKPAPDPIAPITPSAPATRVTTRLLTAGFSAEVARRIAVHVPQNALVAQAESWLHEVLAHNIRCADANEGIVERAGRPASPGQTYALVGPTGVGKTTTVAKLAAQFAVRHGTSALGLITLDSYRIAAPEQLRTYGRILGTPVHLAQDASTLRELLATMVHKRLVLIDTSGVSQRDERLGEMLDLLASAGTTNRPVQRVLLMNGASHAETLEEAARAWRVQECAGAILTKLDEATRIGGALDVSLRHRLTLLGITNGQRVPEDWHAANGKLLAHLALKPAAQLFDLADEEGAALIRARPVSLAAHGATHA